MITIGLIGLFGLLAGMKLAIWFRSRKHLRELALAQTPPVRSKTLDWIGFFALSCLAVFLS
jgi:hypothetical protein